MKNRIKFLSFILLTSLTQIVHSQSMSIAINKSGKQRMLSQRIAKDLLLIGSGIKVIEARNEMDESIANFDETLNELDQFSPNQETKDALLEEAKLWTKFRNRALKDPELEDAEAIINEATILLKACNVVVEKIQAASGKKVARLPNICGRQRMLSQRMAMFYIAHYWKANYKNLNKDFKEAMDSYELSLAMLSDAKENTEEINAILFRQKNDWDFLKKSFDLSNINLLPNAIFSSTNLIVKDFNLATSLYSKILDNNDKSNLTSN